MTDTPMFTSDNNSSGLPADVKALLAEHPEIVPSELEEVWQLASSVTMVEPTAVVDTDRFEAMKAAVHQSIARSPRVDRGPVRLNKRQTTWIVASATVLAGLLMVFWVRPVVVEAPRAALASHQLPDGSDVTLNSGSRLEYRRTFGWRERRVHLEGEGYFDVVSGAKPFSVSTFNGEVEVLGTRFNVQAWDDNEDPTTEVVLEEGSVRFAVNTHEESAIVLKPGEWSVIRGDFTQPSAPLPVDTQERIVWRQGGMIFEDRSVGAVFDEVERRFDISITAQPASLRMDRVTLVFESVEDPNRLSLPLRL